MIGGNEIINSLDSVTISEDGYYVINGFKTGIKTKVPATYYLDENGDFIVKYTDNTTENLGTIGDSLANGVERIIVSNNGFYHHLDR